jgi:seryl-tRNA synthetase
LGTSKKYDIIDFELGVKITGAGFPVYKEKAPNCNVR